MTEKKKYKKRKDGKNDTGRPTILNEATLQKLQAAFSIGANNEEACSYAEISSSAFYDHLSKNPDFSDKIRRWQNRPILKAKFSVVNALSSNPELALKYLERRKKDEFSTKQEVEAKNVDYKIVVSNEEDKKALEDLKNRLNDA